MEIQTQQNVNVDIIIMRQHFNIETAQIFRSDTSPGALADTSYCAYTSMTICMGKITRTSG